MFSTITTEPSTIKPKSIVRYLVRARVKPGTQSLVVAESLWLLEMDSNHD